MGSALGLSTSTLLVRVMCAVNARNGVWCVHTLIVGVWTLRSMSVAARMTFMVEGS